MSVPERRSDFATSRAFRTTPVSEGLRLPPGGAGPKVFEAGELPGSRKIYRMKTVEWLARLDAARTREEVKSILHAYVNCWSSYDRAQLPETCRLPAAAADLDLARLAHCIERELDSFDLDRTRGRLLKVLEIFTARAIARVERLEEIAAGIDGPLAAVPSFAFMKHGPASALPG